MLALVTLLAVAGMLPGWTFNKLVQQRNQVLAAWSDIDVQLLRRHDLVPQLVATVKAYADYEKATLAAVTALRTRSEAATHLPAKAAVEAEVELAVHKLIAVAEAYPAAHPVGRPPRVGLAGVANRASGHRDFSDQAGGRQAQ